MKRTYTTDEILYVNDYLHSLFEQKVETFASEVKLDFTQDAEGVYLDEHMQTLWAGFILNYAIERHSATGSNLDLMPGLLPIADQFFQNRNSVAIPCQL